ncbi:MAG: sugar transporter family protein [Burkholderiales bacterium]|jgi:MHS family proline/betaine transporter-like MFS transporter|nr:sugar transporter family protein [Burkholderiales bacterium]
MAESNIRLKNVSSNNKNLFRISFTTNVFECYDTVISGYLAAIIGHLFFKSSSEVMALILSFATFSAHFLIEPIGGIFWGRFGDKYGAGLATKYSMLVMAIPSCLIGLLPTYDTIGYSAALLLLLMNLVQGFGAGGQVATNFCYIYEQALHNKHSSLFCGLAAAGGWFGSLLASLIAFLLYTNFTNANIYSWAWRIPFLISIPMFIVIFYFRKNIEVNPNNIKVVQKFDWLRKDFIRAFIKCFLLLSFMQICFYMLFVWMPTYLESVLKVAHNTARMSNMLSLITATICVVFWGYLGKHVHYKKVMLFSVSSLLLFSYPLFYLLHSTMFIILIAVQLIFAVIYTPLEGNYVFALGRAFNSKFRNRGYALCWTLSIALFGGTTPVVCSYFIHLFNFNLFPVFYLMLFAVITLPAIYLL